MILDQNNPAMDESRQKKRILITAWLTAALALSFFIGFFVVMANQ